MRERLKIGDTVYTINGNQLKEWKVQLIGYDYCDGIFEMHLATENYTEVMVVLGLDEINKTIFPTLEEAEKALAEGRKR